MTFLQELATSCAIGLLVGTCVLPWRARLHDGTLLEWFLIFGAFWQVVLLGAFGMWITRPLRKRH